MTVSVVIPCYNERATIEQIVVAVRAAPVAPVEIVIVDDGSIDGTAELLRKKLASRVERVIFHRTNQGKGAALRSGFRAVTGDIVIVQDADMEYDPNEYGKLIEPIVNGSAEVVFGSRFGTPAGERVAFFWHRAGNQFLTRLSNRLTKLALTDMETGQKAFRREVIQSIEIEEDGFAVEPEMTAKLAQRGAIIQEVPIGYRRRSYREGKKVGWRDGLRAVYAIFAYSLRRETATRPRTPIRRDLSASLRDDGFAPARDDRRDAPVL